MAKKIKILGIHGVGQHDGEGRWMEPWEDAIARAFGNLTADFELESLAVSYDDLFAAEDITVLGTLEAVGKLAGSGIWHGIGDLFEPLSRGRTAKRSIPEIVRWTAGMVVQWVENEKIRAATRKRVADAIADFKPDVICAHSLGSLVAYDTFVHPDFRDAAKGRTFVSLGSQIGNAFVRSQFAGRITPIDCSFWYHLYNPEDAVFTEPLSVPGENFQQIDCEFDIAGFADHDATSYLQHENTVHTVWKDVLLAPAGRRKARRQRSLVNARGRHERRALLIGINDYPDPESRLEGCVNDVFLMSELLQENGFDASEIRTVLDDRATAAGIRSRIEWLLDGVGEDDKRVLYFSGHGAQIPAYGFDETIDSMDECLVPWDFDWSRERAITDNWFNELYSQLPYEAQFLAVFDCCHSGGLARAGVNKPRGLNPPDDIRHRALRWDKKERAWVDRKFRPANRTLAQSRERIDYLGETGATQRLGRSVPLRKMETREYDRTRKQLGHYGPYLPVIMQACQENELAYEYRHGVTSFGAFTHSLAYEWRARRARQRLTFTQLMKRVSDRLKRLDYTQKPNLVGPKKYWVKIYLCNQSQGEAI